MSATGWGVLQRWIGARWRRQRPGAPGGSPSTADPPRASAARPAAAEARWPKPLGVPVGWRADSLSPPAEGDRAVAESAPLMGDLQRRLLGLLLFPFALLVAVGGWLHYQAAGTVAVQQDQLLMKLAPMLADSILAPEAPDPEAEPAVAALKPVRPVLLMAPPVEEFLTQGGGATGYSIVAPNGDLILGDAWLPVMQPQTSEPELTSVTEGGVTYRLIAQRVQTPVGEVVVQLADGSDARQRWLDTAWKRVLLPNLLLMVVAAVWVRWAVRRALRPLSALRAAVEHRSPRDLSPLPVQSVPGEVRPLVESLNRLFAMVNAQAESQRRFVADAAHQLRTPIAGLQAQVEAWGMAASARREGEAGETSARVELPVEQVLRLRTACRRTTQLANQLLALSRVDATALSSQPMQRVDLQRLCESVLDAQLDEAIARGKDLGLETEPVQVDGYEWLLRELLMNLTDNALRHTPRGAQVTLRCGRDGARAWLAVEDNGPGILPAERPRVLQRFYRLPGTQAEGSGLGLAIADEIARAHGASLSLLDGPHGKGLLVRVDFP